MHAGPVFVFVNALELWVSGRPFQGQERSKDPANGADHYGRKLTGMVETQLEKKVDVHEICFVLEALPKTIFDTKREKQDQ